MLIRDYWGINAANWDIKDHFHPVLIDWLEWRRSRHIYAIIIYKTCKLVKWQSSAQLNNPQVVPVPAAFLLACRLNVSGSIACTAVEVNHVQSSPALAPVKNVYVWRAHISKYNSCFCGSTDKDSNKDTESSGAKQGSPFSPPFFLSFPLELTTLLVKVPS